MFHKHETKDIEEEFVHNIKLRHLVTGAHFGIHLFHCFMLQLYNAFAFSKTVPTDYDILFLVDKKRLP